MPGIDTDAMFTSMAIELGLSAAVVVLIVLVVLARRVRRRRGQ